MNQYGQFTMDEMNEAMKDFAMKLHDATIDNRIAQLHRNYFPVINEDCYHFVMLHDMNAQIPQCKRETVMGTCKCEMCEHYIKKSDVDELVELLHMVRKSKNDKCDKEKYEDKDWQTNT